MYSSPEFNEECAKCGESLSASKVEREFYPAGPMCKVKIDREYKYCIGCKTRFVTPEMMERNQKKALHTLRQEANRLERRMDNG